MMKITKLRVAINWTSLGVFSVLVGAAMAHQDWSAIAAPSLAIAIVALSLLFGLAAIVGGLGYGEAARATGLDTRPSDGLAIFGTANLAKYLPSNVLHFAGRQYLAHRRGWPQSVALIATLVETGGIVAISTALAWALIGWLLVPAWLFVGGTVAGLAVVALAWVVGLPWLNDVAERSGLEPPHMRPLASAGAHLSIFVLLSGIVALLVARQIGMDGTAHLIIGAWLAGYAIGVITPFAPGGIGSREAAVVVLAGMLGLDMADATTLGVLMRLVTILGEVVLFAAAATIMRSRDDVVPPDAPYLGGVARDLHRQWRLYWQARRCGLDHRLALRHARDSGDEPDLTEDRIWELQARAAE